MPAKKTTRETIITQATEVFHRQGYTATSISDLSAACGIRNAHFYYYFQNKEDLMAAVLRTVHQSIAERLQRLAGEESNPPAARLKKMMQLVERLFLSQHPASEEVAPLPQAGLNTVMPGVATPGCIMANTTLEMAYGEPVFRPILMAFFEDWIVALQQIYGTQYPAADARERAEATVQDIEGGLMLTKLYREDRYLLNALRRAEKQLN